MKDQTTKATLLKGTLREGLYHFLLHRPKKSSHVHSSLQSKCISFPAACTTILGPPAPSAFFSSNVKLNLDLWHKRLGHCNFEAVEKALHSCNIPFNATKSSILCHPCCIAKSHKLPYSSSHTQYTAPLQLIHSDVWGPAPLFSINGFSYYVTFVDQFSRYTWLYLLKSKGDVFIAFKHFKTLAENQLNCSIKAFQSDWGGEFQGLTSFLQDHGIQHKVFCPYTPQKNNMAERKHRHIVEMGLALLAQSSLPASFWDDAFTTACFLINRIPTKTILHPSPFEKLFKSKPDYHQLRVFGCLCYPHVRPYNKNKLQFRSDAATFLGYSPHHKGYKALLSNGKTIITRDIIFDESSFHHNKSSPTFINTPTTAFVPPCVQPTGLPISSSHISPSPHIQSTPTPIHDNAPPITSLDPVSHSDDLNLSTHTPTTSPSHTTPPSHNSSPALPTHSMITRSKAGTFKPKIYLHTTSSTLEISLVIPKSHTAALLVPVWKKAMEEEFLALLKNKTWILTTLPPGKNLVGCTWIFKLKKDVDGMITRHKARLVAQGFSQQAGFDFTDTFSPVG